jgi:hypothetical protein
MPTYDERDFAIMANDVLHVYFTDCANWMKKIEGIIKSLDYRISTHLQTAWGSRNYTSLILQNMLFYYWDL